MESTNATMPADAALLLARMAMSALFLIEGAAKLSAWGPSQAYMQKFGVPGGLLPAVVALEIGAGLAVLVGFKTPWAALALAVFCAAAAALFHNNLADHGQALHFWKDLAIAGGFLALAASGGGRWSVDGILRQRGAPRP